jgi:hypothetical protein
MFPFFQENELAGLQDGRISHFIAAVLRLLRVEDTFTRPAIQFDFVPAQVEQPRHRGASSFPPHFHQLVWSFRITTLY